MDSSRASLQPPYIDLEAPLTDEEAAIRLQQQISEEEALLQGDRAFVPYAYAFYAALLGLQSVLLGCLLYSYSDNWDKECDLGAKVWSLVCVLRGLLQLLLNMATTTLRLQQQQPPHRLLVSSRIIYFSGFLWWLLGFRLLVLAKGCQGETTLAETVSLVLFWATAVVYAVPFFIYSLLCLFLPCIIYFFVRFSVPPADRQPTPNDILRRLETKTYRELLEALKRQYNIENDALIEARDSSLLPSLSLEGVLGGVSSLLGGPGGPPGPQGGPPAWGRGPPAAAAAAADRGGPQRRMQPQAPSISVNRCCPICMVELADEDVVLVMPCDSRHFFHRGCVEHWLETSQACPICRANIVHLITGAAGPSQGERGVEMQV